MTHQATNREICGFFNVAIYPVEDLPEGAAPGEEGKFVVTTLASDDFDGVEFIPLADTQEAGEALAVEHLGLRARYENLH